MPCVRVDASQWRSQPNAETRSSHLVPEPSQSDFLGAEDFGHASKGLVELDILIDAFGRSALGIRLASDRRRERRLACWDGAYYSHVASFDWRLTSNVRETTLALTLQKHSQNAPKLRFGTRKANL
jgi:hypothetical protein